MDNRFDIKDAVVLVTGATSGIGKACAYEFARLGAKLILVARRNGLLESIASDLASRFQVAVLPLCVDIRDKHAVHDGLQSIPENFHDIRILVNNAGTVTSDNKFHEMTELDIDTMIDTNLKGLLYVTRQLLPGMLDRNAGHIVNIGSIASDFCYPGGSVYVATKYAVKAMTKSLRMDLLGKPIRVSQINPGATRSELSEIRWDKQKADEYYSRFTALDPVDIAEAVIFCCTRKSYVNIDTITLTPLEQVGTTIKPIVKDLQEESIEITTDE